MLSKNVFMIVVISAVVIGFGLLISTPKEEAPIPAASLNKPKDEDAVKPGLSVLQEIAKETEVRRPDSAKSKPAASEGETESNTPIVVAESYENRSVEELKDELKEISEEYLAKRLEVVTNLIDRGLTVATTDDPLSPSLDTPGNSDDFIHVVVTSEKLNHLVKVYRHEEPQLFAMNDRRKEIRATIEVAQGFAEAPSVRTFRRPR